MDFDSRFCGQLCCGLFGDLGCGVFTVVVDYNYGEFARIVLLEEAGYGLADGCGFVSCWHDGGDTWPDGWGLGFCEIVVEFAEAPEHAAE